MAAPSGVFRAGTSFRLAAWLSVLGLGGCEAAQEVSVWPIALRQVGDCNVGVPSQIELVALGDFPSRVYALPDSGAIDDVRFDLRQLLVRVTTPLGVAEGRRVWKGPLSVPSGDEQSVWLMRPDGPSCPLGDAALNVKGGAVVAPLAEGGALLAGGSETETLGSSNALLLVEGQGFRSDVEGGMLLRRAYATATALEDAVVIAGGTADLRAGAHDTYEVFEPKAARFVAARSGKLAAARMQHAAVRLPDGRVLLIGGRAEASGPPLASVEILDLERGASQLLMQSGLQVARALPSAFLLDSGRVLVAGGRAADGTVVASVEVFEPQEQRFELRLNDLPARAEVSVAALPGARLAWLSCDHSAQAQGAQCELWLIHEARGELHATPVALDFSREAHNGLKDLQLLYAGDGQLLWTGADDSDPMGRRRAFVIELADSSLRRVDASRVPALLLRLENDLIAELDGSGMSLRAAFTRGRYASPEGDLLADPRANLAFDAPIHWHWQDGGAQALEDAARVDAAEMRFAAFRGNVKVQGNYALLVYDGLGGSAQARVRDGTLEVPGCRAQLQGDDGLQLSRRGTRLAFSGTACSVEAPSGAVGVALLLDKSAVLHGLTLERL